MLREMKFDSIQEVKQGMSNINLMFRKLKKQKFAPIESYKLR